MDFTFNIKSNDKASIISLEGNLIDKTSAQSMLQDVDALILKGNNRFIVSLENSKYINSSGLNVLINILTKARRSGGEVVVCSVPEKINELLLVTKLNTVFTVVDSLDEALKVI